MSTDMNNHIVLTRDQFNSSVGNAIDRAGVKGSQANRFKEQAASIFTANDTQGSNGTQGADGRWNQTEADSGSSQLAELYNMINSAVKGEIKDSEVNARLELQQFKLMSPEAQAAKIDGEVDKFLTKKPEEQAAEIINDLNVLKADGNEIKLDNKNIYVGGQLINLEGVSPEAQKLIIAEVENMTGAEG